MLQQSQSGCLQFEEQAHGQQREKLVANLKDQIKKLQKDRDKIKAWCELRLCLSRCQRFLTVVAA